MYEKEPHKDPLQSSNPGIATSCNLIVRFSVQCDSLLLSLVLLLLLLSLLLLLLLLSLLGKRYISILPTRNIVWTLGGGGGGDGCDVSLGNIVGKFESSYQKSLVRTSLAE